MIESSSGGPRFVVAENGRDEACPSNTPGKNGHDRAWPSIVASSLKEFICKCVEYF